MCLKIRLVKMQHKGEISNELKNKDIYLKTNLLH